MKRDLIWGWVFAACALLMIALIFYGCYIGNWGALPMCCFALILNVTNAITRFVSYKERKRWLKSMESFNEAFSACWSEDENRIV